MTVDSRSAIGEPVFSSGGAPDTGADLTTLGQEIYRRGTRLVGTETERNSYAYPTEGLSWWNTTRGWEDVYTSGVWKMKPTTQTVTFTPSPGYTLTANSYLERSAGGRITGLIQVKKDSGTIAHNTVVGTIAAGSRPVVDALYPGSTSMSSATAFSPFFVQTTGTVTVYSPVASATEATLIVSFKSS